MKGGWAVVAGLHVAAILGCGGAWWPIGIQVASGDPALVRFDGVLETTMSIAPTSPATLEAMRPDYPRTPNVGCPAAGTWLVARHAKAGTPADQGEGWSFEACAPTLVDPVWHGGCGGPKVDQDLPAKINTFTDAEGHIVVAILPLEDGGLARFEGRLPSRAPLAGSAEAIGVWTLQWCRFEGRPTPLGAGTVRLFWTGSDPLEWRVPP